jgi:hypothetical protein
MIDSFGGTGIPFVTGLFGGSRFVCPFWFPDQLFIPRREDSITQFLLHIVGLQMDSIEKNGLYIG